MVLVLFVLFAVYGGDKADTLQVGQVRLLVDDEPSSFSSGDAESPAQSDLILGKGSGEPVLMDAEVAARLSGGVTVHVTYGDHSPVDKFEIRMVRNLSIDSIANAEARKTDVAGTASWSHLALGRWFIMPERGEFRPVDIEAGIEKEVSITTAVGIRVEGTVVDTAEQPVAGVTVFACDAAELEAARSIGQTDDTGRFSSSEVASGVHVFARGARYCPVALVMIEGAPGSRAQVVLRVNDGGGCAGVVRSSDGSPVAGATVIVGGDLGWPRSREDGPHTELEPPFVTALTGTDGQFSLGGLPVGMNKLVARKEGLRPGTSTFAVMASEIARIEVRLVRGCELRGVVSDTSGRAVEGARVGVSGVGGSNELATWSNGDGSYSLCGLADGVQVIECESGAERVMEEVALRIDVATEWNPVLSNGDSLRVRVVDSDSGAGLAGWVVITKSSKPKGKDGRFFVTDGDGYAEIAHDEPRLAGIVVYEPGVKLGFPRASHGPIDMQTTHELVVPVLGVAHLACVRGVIVAAPSEDVLGMALSLRAAGMGADTSAPIEESGMFSSPRVPVGKYVLEVRHGGALAYQQLVDLSVPGTVDVGTILVERPCPVTIWMDSPEGLINVVVRGVDDELIAATGIGREHLESVLRLPAGVHTLNCRREGTAQAWDQLVTCQGVDGARVQLVPR